MNKYEKHPLQRGSAVESRSYHQKPDVELIKISHGQIHERDCSIFSAIEAQDAWLDLISEVIQSTSLLLKMSEIIVSQIKRQ